MGHEACLTTESETLPIKALLKGPRPRLPMTISPVPNLPALLSPHRGTRPSHGSPQSGRRPLLPYVAFLRVCLGHLLGDSLQLARQSLWIELHVPEQGAFHASVRRDASVREGKFALSVVSRELQLTT